ncbi:hypothetical protein [uncultured Phenylobacterium sp.]|uniref:hypothetical protein n=1 Tax=uncultured Phenylobacterium sp. TaxID=349273 RepID=UPI0025F6CB59|nr:hypothetical protein [uncultured Phenylobacterium sp.]
MAAAFAAAAVVSSAPVAEPAEPPIAAAVSLFGAEAAPRPAEALVEVRGRGGLIPVSLVSGNQVVFQGPADVTQQNTIDGSFNGASGVFTVVQNAGNNASVVVQTNVWINVTP